MAALVHMQIAKESDPTTFVAGFTSQDQDTNFAGKMIEISYVEQTVSIPFETGNNVQATSNRTHSPVLVRKRVDAASPQLREFMRMTESLTVEFFFHRPAKKTSGDYRFYGIKLTGAKVASVKTYSPDAFVSREAEALVPIEDIAFTFDTITTSFYNEGQPSAISSADSHSKTMTTSG